MESTHEDVARAAGLVEPEPPIERSYVQPLPSAPIVLCDGWLADIAENVLPDLGLAAPERVLGPMADERPSRRQRAVAGGVMAFSPNCAPRVRPVDRWYKDRRGTTDDERAAVRAVDRAPPMVWRVRAGAAPEPLLPLHSRLCPDGPARRLATGEGQPMQPLPAGCWLARIFPGPEGWCAALALPLSAVPDPAWLLRRLRLELWYFRTYVPEADWILLLRERGEVLYRCCHEWVWTTRRFEP